MAGQKRASSVTLSAIKVKTFLAEKGIYSLKEFEIYYAQAQGKSLDGAEDTAPRKAWTNKKLANRKALAIASFLGLKNELSLLPDSKSPWESLVYSSKYQQDFMTFHIKELSQFSLAIFDNCTNPDYEDINKHKIHSKFHLSLSGHKDDHFFIILRSLSKFLVLAPVTYKGHKNKHCGETLRYPQGDKAFQFDKGESLGFRELIVIRINSPIPIARRSDQTGMVINLAELNAFANQLLLDKILLSHISVANYPFILIE